MTIAVIRNTDIEIDNARAALRRADIPTISLDAFDGVLQEAVKSGRCIAPKAWTSVLSSTSPIREADAGTTFWR
ncbi:hypothetical protein AB0I30_32355 [Nocardia tengchongensis]|uniref:hypothetical protein n=1 Tax=Nocardia tengchongensis TaxID=2055889 RepID=UPI0033EBE42B